ncbi:MAG: hypothetical protein ABEJ22_09275 [Haloferacaceae archaeon]
MPASDSQTELNPEQTIAVPASLVERVEDRLPHTDFDSPGEYVAYVVREVLASVEESDDADDHDTVDADEVQERLRSLGYLDEE